MRIGKWYGNPFSNLVIPDSFGQCLSYAQRQAWLYRKITELEARVAALEGTAVDETVDETVDEET